MAAAAATEAMPSSSSSSSSSASSLEQIATLSPSSLAGSPAWSASFSIDGQYLAVCFGNPDTRVKVWEHCRRRRRRRRQNQKRTSGGDGLNTTEKEVSTNVNKCIGHNQKCTNVPSGRTQNDDDDDQEEQDEWKLIAILRDDGDDPKTKKKMKRTIRSVAFAPTSSTLGVPILATASFDGSVLIWEHSRWQFAVPAG